MTITEALKEAKKKAEKKVNQVLADDVFKTVRDEELKQIDDTVYAMEVSGRYQRRFDEGGLLDPDHIVIDGGAVSDGRLVVSNITPANPFLNGMDSENGLSTTPLDAKIAKLVEFGEYHPNGYGYDWWKRAKPRPFIENTRKVLKRRKSHVAAMKKGLKKRGVKVR